MFSLMTTTQTLSASMEAAQALFAALRDPMARSAAEAQHIRELLGEFEQHWAGVASAASELDAEEVELSGLLDESSQLSEVLPAPPIPARAPARPFCLTAYAKPSP